MNAFSRQGLIQRVTRLYLFDLLSGVPISSLRKHLPFEDLKPVDIFMSDTLILPDTFEETDRE